jgi:diaminohydroxyphosphoribosylaminopyrimidine deaminase/5-amino-6-(5-phosphoribosylamino)uracil reductase
MQRAIELALRGRGRTSPNPIVGAVVVKGGRVVGEGFHARAGGPHAEVGALRKAGAKARGADMYVTLEPCCHEGRTPPCVDAIVGAGVKRVFVGSRDPNPLVDGRGIKALRKSGVEVKVGTLREECRSINEAYNKFAMSGMPFVTAKAALTLDGKIATASGSSKWITNAKCREFVHTLRAQSDAVLVGGGTIRKDDPRLTARTKGSRGKDPVAVVVDESLDIPRGARIFERRAGELVFITTERAEDWRIKRIESLGYEVIVLKSNRQGMVDAAAVLKVLGERGVVSVLVEGGGHTFASFARGRAIDRIVACIAPKLVGGEGLDFLPGVKTATIDDAVTITGVNFKSFGDNAVIEGCPNWR